MKDLPKSKLELMADSAGGEVTATEEEAQIMADGNGWDKLRGGLMGFMIGPYALPTMIRRAYEAYKEPAWTKKAVSNTASTVSTTLATLALCALASTDTKMDREFLNMMAFYSTLSAGYELNAHRILGRKAVEAAPHVAKGIGQFLSWYMNAVSSGTKQCVDYLGLRPQAQIPAQTDSQPL